MSTKTTTIAKDGILRQLFASVVSFEAFLKVYVQETASTVSTVRRRAYSEAAEWRVNGAFRCGSGSVGL